MGLVNNLSIGEYFTLSNGDKIQAVNEKKSQSCSGCLFFKPDDDNTCKAASYFDDVHSGFDVNSSKCMDEKRIFKLVRQDANEQAVNEEKEEVSEVITEINDEDTRIDLDDHKLGDIFKIDIKDIKGTFKLVADSPNEGCKNCALEKCGCYVFDSCLNSHFKEITNKENSEANPKKPTPTYHVVNKLYPDFDYPIGGLVHIQDADKDLDIIVKVTEREGCNGCFFCDGDCTTFECASGCRKDGISAVFELICDCSKESAIIQYEQPVEEQDVEEQPVEEQPVEEVKKVDLQTSANGSVYELVHSSLPGCDGCCFTESFSKCIRPDDIKILCHGEFVYKLVVVTKPDIKRNLLL